MHDLLAAAAAVVAVSGALAALTQWVVRPVTRTLKRLRAFLDDWNGEPARPGVPARLGVMERIDAIEHELHPNSGRSLRDRVDATHALIEQRLDTTT